MNTERLFKTVMMDLSLTQAKLEEKLEKVVNSDKDLDEKTKLITELLVELAQIELAMGKFNSMFTSNKNNENPQ